MKWAPALYFNYIHGNKKSEKGDFLERCLFDVHKVSRRKRMKWFGLQISQAWSPTKNFWSFKTVDHSFCPFFFVEAWKPPQVGYLDWIFNQKAQPGPAELFLKGVGRWPPLLKWEGGGGWTLLRVFFKIYWNFLPNYRYEQHIYLLRWQSKFVCSPLWLFRTLRLLNLSWVFVESTLSPPQTTTYFFSTTSIFSPFSHNEPGPRLLLNGTVFNFQAAEKVLSPTALDCTCRIQRSWSGVPVTPFLLSKMSSKHVISQPLITTLNSQLHFESVGGNLIISLSVRSKKT